MGKKPTKFSNSTNVVDAPEERMQVKQDTVNAVEDASKVSTHVDDFKKKTVKSSGATLKQEVAAEALTGKGIGGTAPGVSPATTFGLMAQSFSGDTGTLLGDVSGTPSMGTPYQGRTRVDKRLSDANKDINFIASEQVIVERDAIPALADSESDVGYNGNPKSVSARSQKKSGQSSAELLYDRSLDFITKDAFVFTSGQVVKQRDIQYEDYPTITVTLDPLNDTADFERVRGNYSPRNLQVQVTRGTDGVAYVSSFIVEEDDFSCNNEHDIIVNQSSTNQAIDLNRAELARQTIDANAGSPTSEHFNPLGRSVQQPTATLAYLQDIENVTGAEVATAIRFAGKAKAHYLNRTAKDGQDLIGPAIDALYGGIMGALDSQSLLRALPDINNTFFSQQGMAHGSAALLISMFDSPRKYTTKADIVNQPRGLKMHLQTAINNSSPFRCKPEFIKALNHIDVYNTIDHGYDPTAPVYITDNVRLIHPYSWAESLAYHRDSAGPRIYDSNVFRYAYSAGSGQNSYIITCGDPVLNGVAYWLDMHADKIYRAISDTAEDNVVTLNIPIVHSTTHFSLWDLIVCASTPYIIYERTNTLKDILDYELFYKYPLQGNETLSAINPLATKHYGMIDPTRKLTVSQLEPVAAMSWKYPETLIKLGSRVLLPWYFNERSYDFVEEGENATMIYNGSAEFSTPVIRSGIKLQGLNDFFGLDVKDQLLITDRMTRIPGNVENEAFHAYVYKYSQDSDGLIAMLNSDNTSFTVQDWCSTPRLLGWYFDAPAHTCNIMDGEIDEDTNLWVPALGVIPAADSINLASMRPSFKAIQYKALYREGELIVDRPLQAGSVAVSRAQAFTQGWAAKYAGYGINSPYFDLTLSINEAIEYNNELNNDPRFITISDRAQFSPYVTGEYDVDENRETTNTAYSIPVERREILFSPHVMLWTHVQKTCFVLNPFENSDDNRPAADPFGLSYLFGLAGFLSADYNEIIYNRANQYQYEGYGYTVDPLVAITPSLK